MTNSDLFFCSGKRIEFCKLSSNLCCLKCNYNDYCTDIAKRSIKKIKPCKPEDFDVDEICGFLV